MYNCIQGLRNSFASIHAALPALLVAVVHYCDAAVIEHTERQFWTCLGVCAKWLDVFVEVGPRWIDGRLHVRDSIGRSAEAWSKTSSVWTYAMK